MQRRVICIRCSGIINSGTPLCFGGDNMTALSVCEPCRQAESETGRNRYEVEAIEPERGSWMLVTIMLALIYWPATLAILVAAFIFWMII